MSLYIKNIYSHLYSLCHNVINKAFMAKPANLFGNIILLPCNKYSEKGTLYHAFTNTVSLAEEYTEQRICEANNVFYKVKYWVP